MDFQPASIIKPLSQYVMQKADPGHFQTSNQMNFKPNCFETPNKERVKRWYYLYINIIFFLNM